MLWESPPQKLQLAPLEVHLWQASLDISEDEYNYLVTLLSLDEKQRAERYKFAKHRRRNVAARGRLRLILSRYLQTAPEAIEFRYGEYGKPYLSDAQNKQKIYFNMSDAQELALYSITLEREIGVDVEYLQREVEDEQLAQRFFAPAEYQALLVAPQSERHLAFFYGWTRKEAFIKAIGEGLTHALSDFEVVLTPGVPAALLSIKGNQESAKQWTLCNVEVSSDYVAALVVQGLLGEMKQFMWADL